MPEYTWDHVHLRTTDPEATAQWYERGIDAVVAELKAKGVEFTREPTTVRPGVRVAFLRAPEGVSIELLDRNA
jgi:catechol 2,3-dioxygenase-like lactoylglutathione lyase family enzyme